MQINRLITVALKSSIKEKQLNGTYTIKYNEIKPYKVQREDLTDEISASIYGANVVNMLRLSSPKKDLEKFLLTKVNESIDNISKYFIFINDATYKIKSVKSNWIDIERL